MLGRLVVGATCLLWSCAAAAAEKPVVPLVSYALPRTVVDVEVKHLLKACQVDDETVKGAKVAALVVKTTATVTVRAEADPVLLYQLDPSAFSNSRTKLDLGLEFYDTGTVKSINATAEDRTGAIAGNVVGGLLSLGKLVAMFADGQQKLTSACTDKTQATLDSVAALKAEIAALKAQIRKLDIDKPKSDQEGLADIKRYREKLAITQTLLAETEDRLTLTLKKTIAPDASLASRRVTLSPTPKQLTDSWIVSDAAADALEGPELKAAREALGATDAALATIDLLSVEIAIRPDRPLPKDLIVVSDTKPVAGVVLRDAIGADVLVCRYLCALPKVEVAEGGKAEVLQKVHADFSQLGNARVLDLKSKTFQSKTLAVTLTPFGRVQTAKLVSNSRAEAASAVFKDLAGQLGTALPDIAKAKDTAELDQIKLETSLLDAARLRIEAKKKLDDAIAAQDP